MMPDADFCSIWQWLSMPPGSTSMPPASISRAPAATALPSVAMLPDLTPMSQRTVSEAVTTVPLRMTRSYSAIGGVSPIVARRRSYPASHPFLQASLADGTPSAASSYVVVDRHDGRLRRGNACPHRRFDLPHLALEMPHHRGDRLARRLHRAVGLTKEAGVAAHRRRHHLVDADCGMVMRGAQQTARAGGAEQIGDAHLVLVDLAAETLAEGGAVLVGVARGEGAGEAGIGTQREDGRPIRRVVDAWLAVLDRDLCGGVALAERGAVAAHEVQPGALGELVGACRARSLVLRHRVMPALRQAAGQQ